MTIKIMYMPQIPCELDDRFAGLVEAWASSVTWQELLNNSKLDEGDLARLLRRTIDLLAQVCFPLLTREFM
jgi:superfamily II RNA helicase